MKYGVLRHVMADFVLTALSKEFVLFKNLCVAVSNAIFKIIPESRRKVHAHLSSIGEAQHNMKRAR